MRVSVDADLLARAKAAVGMDDDVAVIERALRETIDMLKRRDRQLAAYDALLGSCPEWEPPNDEALDDQDVA